MKFPLSWLKQHLDTDASLEIICDTLTAIGLEVESIDNPGKALEPFIVAQINEAVDHPDSDHLHICKVDTGKDVLQIVCGAANARAGLKVVLARPGDVMPDTGKALKAGKIRGVESFGMMCAVDELGIGDEHEGIIELDADAPLGGNFAAYAGYDDPVIEINLTPNRPDCAGVLGVARDLAAAGLGTLKDMDTTPVKGTEPCGIKVSLDLPDDNKACPLFVGRVIRNIKNGTSPEWLQKKLRAVGLRPISALVDITNYMTIDCARPLHVFDVNKIKGSLWIAEAEGGETLNALNDKSYTLEKGMTVIGDDTGVLSLAGVVGGIESSCTESTTDVFIEAAYFDPVRTAITGRALQIPSDARYRFERGVDPLFTQTGAELATKHVLELCGTDDTIVSELTVVGHAPTRTEPITLDLEKCLKHTGIDVSADEQRAFLEKLGFTVTPHEQTFTVIPPSWRPDIDNDADLIEEITRLKGYDHLPVTSLPNASVVTHMALDEDERRAHVARRALAGRGLMEALTWSFLSEKEANVFGGVKESLRLKNPISVELSVMRPSLLPNLMAAATRNIDHGLPTVRLFEVGPTFHDAGEDGQISVACALRAGALPRHWNKPTCTPDVFDAKADAIAVLNALGAPIASLQTKADAPAWYHPGRSGTLCLGPRVLATFGEIHPQLRDDFSVNGLVVGCEVFISNIPSPRAKGTAKKLLTIETHQPVTRDFAFVVDRKVPAAKIVQAAAAADKKLIRAADVFDVYEGDKIDANKKSLALSVTIQPQDKTLTDAEIDALAAKIETSVNKATGAVLRG